jgi:uncharacterized protein (TIGR03437 family)
LNQDGRVNAPETTARVGEVLQLFCTGLGGIPLSQMPEDGSPAAGAVPMTTAPLVFANAVQITPEYAGLAPGLVGVWQVNFRIPSNFVPTGSGLNLAENIVVRAEGNISTLLGPNQRIFPFVYVRR